MFRQTLIYQHKDTNGVFNQKVSSDKRPASPKCILQHVAGLTRWFLFPPTCWLWEWRKMPLSPWMIHCPACRAWACWRSGWWRCSGPQHAGSLRGVRNHSKFARKIGRFRFHRSGPCSNASNLPKLRMKWWSLWPCVPNFIQFPSPSAAFCSGPSTFGGFLRVSHWGVLHG